MHIEIILITFGFILTTLGTLLVNYFREMKTDVKDMSTSIVQLNIKLEKVITDQVWHKEEMDLIRAKLNKLM